jgi:aspartate/methionine/tyrosine aminotransferase
MRLTALAREWSAAASNPFTARLHALRQQGTPLLDLIDVPAEMPAALAAVHAEAPRVYRPQPRGQLEARQAICDYYAARGLPTSAEQIILAPGTSTAYLWALRVLLEPGDELLTPWPGYPLFEDLCRFAGVQQRYYYLRAPDTAGGAWSLDLDDLAFQCTPRTRAVAVVSPHNPLGTVLSESDLEALGALCRQRDMALLFDEVFGEFVAGNDGLPRPRDERLPLAVVFNGLSKMLAMPGHKVAWMRLGGQQAEAAARALEYVADLFLPVTEWGQASTPAWLAAGAAVMREKAAEHATKRQAVKNILGDRMLESAGGVYVCVRLPAESEDDEAAALRLLDQSSVVVHPGYLYHLPGHLVFTTAAPLDTLVEGARRIEAMFR